MLYNYQYQSIIWNDILYESDQLMDPRFDLYMFRFIENQ